MTTTHTLCAVTDCAKPGTHHTDCDTTIENPCPGCHPGIAADGLLICTHHRRRGESDLRDLPGLDDDLILATVRRTQATNVGYVTDGQAASGIVLDEQVMAAKEAMRETLTRLVAFVAHERGVAPAGATHVRTMVTWLLPHLDWLSANKVAAPHWGQAVADVRAGARRRAYRTRPDGTYLGSCTTPVETHDDDGELVAQEACGGSVRFCPSDYSGQSNEATCPRCGTTRTVTEWEVELGDGIVDGGGDGTLYTVEQLVRSIAVRLGKVVAASTIRQWATRGLVTRMDRDERGRTLYDPAEVLRVAAGERIGA